MIVGGRHLHFRSLFSCCWSSIYSEETLLSYFAVKVICDHVSGKSKGYGFVKFTSETEASSALKEMDGQVNLSIMFVSL